MRADRMQSGEGFEVYTLTLNDKEAGRSTRCVRHFDDPFLSIVVAPPSGAAIDHRVAATDSTLGHTPACNLSILVGHGGNVTNNQ